MTGALGIACGVIGVCPLVPTLPHADRGIVAPERNTSVDPEVEHALIAWLRGNKLGQKRFAVTPQLDSQRLYSNLSGTAHAMSPRTTGVMKKPMK